MSAENDPGGANVLLGAPTVTCVFGGTAPNTNQPAVFPVSKSPLIRRFAETCPAASTNAAAHTKLPTNLLVAFIFLTFPLF